MTTPTIVMATLHYNGASIEAPNGALLQLLRRQENPAEALGSLITDRGSSTIFAYDICATSAGMWANFLGAAPKQKVDIEAQPWNSACAIAGAFLSDHHGRQVVLSQTLLGRDSRDARLGDVALSPLMISPDRLAIIDAITGNKLVSFGSHGGHFPNTIHDTGNHMMRKAIADASSTLQANGFAYESDDCKRQLAWLAARNYAASHYLESRHPIPLALLSAGMEPLSPERCSDILTTQPTPAVAHKAACMEM